jgi:hypothetical protein
VPEAAPASGTRHALRLTDTVVLVAVGLAAAILHTLAVALGVRIHTSDLSAASLARNDWQLLPAGLLRNGLLGSLARLHSQPPLFNFATGILLNLPHAMQAYAASGAMVACAVVVAVATAGVLLEFGVNRVVTVVVVGIFVVADPAQYLYGAFYFYALPTAALVTAAAWAAVRWAHTNRVVPGVAYAVLAAALILTNSSYQLYTIALATVPLIWVLRHSWRRVVAVLVGPLLVVVAWYGNDIVQFHTATTSSWLGMNLARATLALDSRADLRALVGEGAISPVALRPPFSPLQAYGTLGTHAPTGHAALDIRFNINTPNYDNIAYVAISRQYLADDLHWIEHRPWRYLKNTTVGLRLWLLPTEQYYATDQLPHYHLGGYTTVYDALVGLQPSADPTAVVTVLTAHQGPGLSSLSITAIAETLLALVVLPIVAWRRRRRDPRGAAGALWIWVLCASVFVTTTLLEAAENNRFRFELGGLLLCGATVAVVWLVDRSGLGRGLLGGARRERDGRAGEALAVDDEPPRVAAGGRELEGAKVDGHGDVDG